MRARNLCRGSGLVTALTVLLGIGVAAEARDLRGAWVTDKSTCKKVCSQVKGPNLEARRCRFLRQWVHLREQQAEWKKCELRHKIPEAGRDVLYLVTLRANDVTFGRVQFSLKIQDDNEITRFFPGVSELETKYYRCSP
jgi:hypothetical protein